MSKIINMEATVFQSKGQASNLETHTYRSNCNSSLFLFRGLINFIKGYCLSFPFFWKNLRKTQHTIMMENAIQVSHMEWVLEYYGSKCEGDVVKVGIVFYTKYLPFKVCIEKKMHMCQKSNLCNCSGQSCFSMIDMSNCSHIHMRFSVRQTTHMHTEASFNIQVQRSKQEK
jgi:hypothetical protein